MLNVFSTAFSPKMWDQEHFFPFLFPSLTILFPNSYSMKVLMILSIFCLALALYLGPLLIQLPNDC